MSDGSALTPPPLLHLDLPTQLICTLAFGAKSPLVGPTGAHAVVDEETNMKSVCVVAGALQPWKNPLSKILYTLAAWWPNWQVDNGFIVCGCVH